MTAPNRPLPNQPAVHADRFPLSGRELLLIAAFWALLAVISAANRLLDPRGPGFQLTVTSAPVALAFVDSALWALFTVVVFWMAWRFTPERGSRWRTVLVFAGAGIAGVLIISYVTDLARSALFPPPPPAPPAPSRGARSPVLFSAFRIVYNCIIYLAVLAAALARNFSLRYRARQAEAVRLQADSARLEAQLAEARLDALRMQLDPHFLFNTLHAISSLVERDPRGVRRMISRLSDLLRHTIEGPTEQEIPLRDELDLLRRYLDIMEVRFQGRLEVRMRVDEGVLDALVPNLILQPLVENAIKHGVDRVSGPGRIEIAAERAGGDVTLRVADNGPGGAARTDAEVGARLTTASAAAGSSGSGAAPRSGVGIRNTMARLEQLYGDAQRFSLRREGDCTVAEIVLPYHTRADVRAAAVGQ